MATTKAPGSTAHCPCGQAVEVLPTDRQDVTLAAKVAAHVEACGNDPKAVEVR